MKQSRQRGRPRHPDILTPAEWRVADSVRHGLTNPQIAERLNISPGAVKFHVSNILGKLAMQARSELRVWDGTMRDCRIARNRTSEDSMSEIGQIARTVSDIDAARLFYAEVLELDHLFDAGGMAFFDCCGIRLMLSQGEAGPESILYFRTDNLHAHCERLVGRGAKLLSAPHKIHTHDDGSEEWMAFIEDNDGRPLGLMSVTPST